MLLDNWLILVSLNQFHLFSLSNFIAILYLSFGILLILFFSFLCSCPFMFGMLVLIIRDALDGFCETFLAC